LLATIKSHAGIFQSSEIGKLMYARVMGLDFKDVCISYGSCLNILITILMMLAIVTGID
jgi:hypothetical protein